MQLKFCGGGSSSPSLPSYRMRTKISKSFFPHLLLISLGFIFLQLDPCSVMRSFACSISQPHRSRDQLPTGWCSAAISSIFTLMTGSRLSVSRPLSVVLPVCSFKLFPSRFANGSICWCLLAMLYFDQHSRFLFHRNQWLFKLLWSLTSGGLFAVYWALSFTAMLWTDLPMNIFCWTSVIYF